MLSNDGLRAARPAGFIAWVGAAFAQLRAADPEPPQQWTPPRGLGELNVLLAQVRAAGSSAVLPPIARDATGTSLLTAREWCARAGVAPAVGCLAVLLASEAEKIGSVPQYAWAIGEACINAAAAASRAPTPLEDALVHRIVGDSRPAMDGRFTKQGGRWASTAQQPNGQHLHCARVLVERANNGLPEILAHGATQWTDNQTPGRHPPEGAHRGQPRQGGSQPGPRAAHDAPLRRGRALGRRPGRRHGRDRDRPLEAEPARSGGCG